MFAPCLSLVVAAAPLQLDWTAPPGCHAAPRALEEISRLLGRPPAVDGDVPLVAHVTISPGASQPFHLALSLEGPSTGERSLDGDSCDDVSSAAELIIALAIDPDAVARVQAGAPPAVAAPPPPPPSVSTARVSVGASAGLDSGTLPRLSPGVEVAAALRWRRLEGRVGASWWPAQRAAGARAGTGAEVSLVAAGLRGAFVLVEAPIELLLQAGADLGLMNGQGFGLDVVEAGTAPWAAAIAGLELALPVTRRFRLHARLDGGTTLLAPAFTIDGVGTIHRSSVFFGRLGLGAEVVFP